MVKALRRQPEGNAEGEDFGAVFVRFRPKIHRYIHDVIVLKIGESRAKCLLYDHGLTPTMLGRIPYLLQRPALIFADSKNMSLNFAGATLRGGGRVALVAVRPRQQVGSERALLANIIVTGHEPNTGWGEVVKRLLRGELIYRDTTQALPETVHRDITE